jgi:hypothetical protein
LKPSRRSRVSFMRQGLADSSCWRTIFCESQFRRLGSCAKRDKNPSFRSGLHWTIQQTLPGLGPAGYPFAASARRMNRRARKGNCRADQGGGFPDLSGLALADSWFQPPLGDEGSGQKTLINP